MMAQRAPREEAAPKFEEAEGCLDLYADSMQILTQLYTALLLFGEIRPDAPPLVRAKIKVSPHMLKAVALLTSKHVRDFEAMTGQPIKLPNQVLHDWGLEEEIT